MIKNAENLYCVIRIGNVIHMIDRILPCLGSSEDEKAAAYYLSCSAAKLEVALKKEKAKYIGEKDAAD